MCLPGPSATAFSVSRVAPIRSLRNRKEGAPSLTLPIENAGSRLFGLCHFEGVSEYRPRAESRSQGNLAGRLTESEHLLREWMPSDHFHGAPGFLPSCATF